VVISILIQACHGLAGSVSRQVRMDFPPAFGLRAWGLSKINE
jgi:hypothetical protein